MTTAHSATGVIRMSDGTDFYELLGLKRDASAEDIKREYRKLARKTIPM